MEVCSMEELCVDRGSNYNSQETSSKDTSHQDFLPQRHLQPPHAWHRQEQDGEIRYHVEYPRGLKGSKRVEAMSSFHERIPYLLPWCADEYLEDALGQVHYQHSPDAEV